MRADRLDQQPDRWPVFTPAAPYAGFSSVYATTMRLRETRIGALNMFSDEECALDNSALGVAQALAEVATIGILHERFLRESQALSEQLQNALTSRVIIEQAKGILAEQGDSGVEDAFVTLRVHARNHNLRLTDVASQVVGGKISVDDL